MPPSSRPTVSVCVSAYNTAGYVGQAIESVLAQSLTDLELVILDNASSDDTLAVIEGYDDPRIHTLHVETNLGAAGGRAFALEQARGEWLAVLDSDDWFHARRLETLADLGVRTGADIVGDDVYFIDDGAAEPWSTLFAGAGGLPGVRRIDAATYVESDRWMQPGLRLGLTKPMCRRAFLDMHPDIRPDPALTVVHDYWWVLEALIAGAEFQLTPEPGYYYRARDEGQMVASGVELDTLQQQIDRVDLTIARPEVREDAALVEALQESQRVWSDAHAYIRFRQALQRREIREATALGTQHPSSIRTLVANAPDWLRRRLSRDPMAHHMTRRF